MEKLFIPGTDLSPEVSFDPERWVLSIKGTSAPEDVRAIYYPVLEWIRTMVDTILEKPSVTGANGVIADFDLQYFNSSSGKFLYDIFSELARLRKGNCSIEVRWHHDRKDTDLQEAGNDLGEHSGIGIIFIPK
ncbi:MAG: DUF1987 domain-containing protein [Bacteroidetes bacterium]|nr:DUF1987 domain-containing protein [Bacteroidota bacterium]